ncbi:hypothetical protein AKJ55_00550 [candidate division MSBL1 archaeon SCGC-AAA382M17]|uniref:Uncharacterized protein n=1 Tax=candidate division MSBL1 archaeon SCGC-AAA382M17 TaxID=1698284 RepID=A0ABR5TJZ2_9EURY|nr:hypothetical protein AKJ55_00550 [candidate division MSBL1 archaeon SCGC-AAA382M17]
MDLSEDLKTDRPGELRNFMSCVLESYPDPVMVLVTCSTVHGEMTELSDVDGTVFLNFSREPKLNEYQGKFRGLAEEQFGKSTEKEFYEPHWSVFFYSCEAIQDTDVFARFSGGYRQILRCSISRKTHCSFTGRTSGISFQ